MQGTPLNVEQTKKQFEKLEKSPFDWNGFLLKGIDGQNIRDTLYVCLLQNKWYLSGEQKTILRDTWLVLQSSMESVGTVTFLNMFETHPETLKPFIPEVESLQEIEMNEW